MPNAGELDRIAVADVDIKDEDIVVFNDAGAFQTFKQKDGTERTRLKIGIVCAEGQVKDITLNETSRRALIAGYGKMTEDWVGHGAVAQILAQNVGGEIKKIVYLSPIKGDKKRPITAKKPTLAEAEAEFDDREPGEEG